MTNEKLFSPEEQEEMRKAAMEKTLAQFRNRPANLRDPDSKKVKCHQCGRRMELREFREHTHVIHKVSVKPGKNKRRNYRG